VLAAALAGCGEGTERERPRAGAPTPGTTPSVTEDGDDGDGEFVPPSLADAASEVPLVEPSGTPTSTRAPALLYGADLSWPQCPAGMGIPQRTSHGAPMPTKAARFVIIGLTNGPSFTPNPCLADQVAWARERGLMTAAYAVTSYPRKAQIQKYGYRGPFRQDTKLGLLRNAGYQAALFNVRNLEAAGLPTPVVWVDVEPLTRPFAWSPDRIANRAVVQGTIRGFRDAGFKVGLYSTPRLWHRIVGGFRLGLPEWRAAGQTSRAEALRRCADSWSYAGGPGVIGQWVEANRDRNLTCPGAVTDLEDWFGRF
jgi:hypothetical protein